MSMVRPHSSRVVRGILLVVGTLLLAIGVLGLFLPLLPTTIFLLGAAACYARASDRFYRRLLANRWFGPMIREWREHRAVPRRTKLTALTAIVATFAVSLTFFVTGTPARIAVASVGVAVFTLVARLRVRNPEAPPAADAMPATRGGR